MPYCYIIFRACRNVCIYEAQEMEVIKDVAYCELFTNYKHFLIQHTHMMSDEGYWIIATAGDQTTSGQRMSQKLSQDCHNDATS